MYFMHADNFEGPRASVDSVVFQLIGDELYVLLIKRVSDPFAGQWALPGTYCSGTETIGESMQRALAEKAGISKEKLGIVEQLYTFDSLERDPRGHAITVTYMALSRNLTPKSGPTTQTPQFFPVGALPEALAYDHRDIIEYALERLRGKILYTNAIVAMLPRMFTFTMLQTAYEAILGKTLDKRNFRKKFLNLDMISPTEELIKEGAHRPARLYRFNQQRLVFLERSFD